MCRVIGHSLQNTPLPFRYHAGVAILLAEKQVENKSAYGNENQYDNPCKAFYRIAIFEYDDDDCKNDRQDKSRVDTGI